MSHSTPRRLGVAAAALALGVTGVLAATAPAQAREGGRQLQTDLSGAEEAPGPGDPDGSGDATITVRPGNNAQVCWDVSVQDIANPTAGHIHEAPEDVAGPVVVGFDDVGGSEFAGCKPVAAELARDIIKNPADYYVNVHNAPFPAGAVRGQLSR